MPNAARAVFLPDKPGGNREYKPLPTALGVPSLLENWSRPDLWGDGQQWLSLPGNLTLTSGEFPVYSKNPTVRDERGACGDVSDGKD